MRDDVIFSDKDVSSGKNGSARVTLQMALADKISTNAKKKTKKGKAAATLSSTAKLTDL